MDADVEACGIDDGAFRVDGQAGGAAGGIGASDGGADVIGVIRRGFQGAAVEIEIGVIAVHACCAVTIHDGADGGSSAVEIVDAIQLLPVHAKLEV